MARMLYWAMNYSSGVTVTVEPALRQSGNCHPMLPATLPGYDSIQHLLQEMTGVQENAGSHGMK